MLAVPIDLRVHYPLPPLCGMFCDTFICCMAADISFSFKRWTRWFGESWAGRLCLSVARWRWWIQSTTSTYTHTKKKKPSANGINALGVDSTSPECFMFLSSELDRFALVSHNKRWARTTFRSNSDWPQLSRRKEFVFLVLKCLLSMISMTEAFGLMRWISHFYWAGRRLALDGAGFWFGYRYTCKLQRYMIQKLGDGWTKLLVLKDAVQELREGRHEHASFPKQQATFSLSHALLSPFPGEVIEVWVRPKAAWRLLVLYLDRGENFPS